MAHLRRRRQVHDLPVECINVVLQQEVEDFDVALPPELFVQFLRVQLNRPRLVVELSVTPDEVQDYAQVQIAQAVAEEQEVAHAEDGGQRGWQQVRDVSAGQVVNVMILGDDEAVVVV